MVPKHEKLSEKEVQRLLERYNISKKQLPKMLSSDPVAKALDLKPGDVVKITRKSRSAGESVYYRCVVEK